MSIESILLKHLARSAIFINSHPVKFRNWNNSKEREEGYSNSSFFETIKKGAIVGVLSPNIKVSAKTPYFQYKIKEKMSAAAAVKDLIKMSATIFNRRHWNYINCFNPHSLIKMSATFTAISYNVGTVLFQSSLIN